MAPKGNRSSLYGLSERGRIGRAVDVMRGGDRGWSRGVQIAAGAGAASALIAGLLTGYEDAGERALKTAERYAVAWEREDFRSMRAELSPSAQSEFTLEAFTDAHRSTGRIVTLTGVKRLAEPATKGDARDDVRQIAVPVEVRTRAFASFRQELVLPVGDEGIRWQRELTIPGVRPGETLNRETEAGERGKLLASDGKALIEGPADARTTPLPFDAPTVAGGMGKAEGKYAEQVQALGFSPDATVGTGGLEKAFQPQLGGIPGGRLRAVDANGATRVLASSKPQDGNDVRTTISRRTQEAAITGLGERLGGVAAIDVSTGAVRALAGVALSALQPPGSTFKIVTVTAGLAEGKTTPTKTYPAVQSLPVGGRDVRNAHSEQCGGSLATSFAKSCNTVFAPLGAELGAEKLADYAERFGFNSAPTLLPDDQQALLDPPKSVFPDDIEGDLETGVSAIGQGRVQATTLQIATLAQTIANDGLRMPTPLAREDDLGPSAKPVRVVDEKVARQVRRMMIQVVKAGTGTAAGLPGIQVAGKTGTAELGPKRDAPAPPPGEDPENALDAWFAGYAPSRKPKIAVATLLIEAGADGGEVAAPLAGQVIAAALKR
ncbi:MAG: penicillin-binding transpeptidase domain-containing protein [Solirubrobacterales bacterium]